MKIKAPWPRSMQCDDPYCWDHCIPGYLLVVFPAIYVLWRLACP